MAEYLNVDEGEERIRTCSISFGIISAKRSFSPMGLDNVDDSRVPANAERPREKRFCDRG